jgi:kinesin family protein 15
VRIKPAEAGQRDGFREGRGALTMDAGGRRVLEMGDASGTGGDGASAAPSALPSSAPVALGGGCGGGGGGGGGDATKAFAPDCVFGPDAGQGEVFAAAAQPLVAGVLGGRNASVIAYGQTGSGKTHTMLGDPASLSGKGVIPRALEELFAGGAALAAAERARPGVASVAVDFTASYVEVHNEVAYDLLAPAREPPPLRLREEAGGGDANFFLEGVTRVPLASPAAALEALAAGFAARRTTSTAMNARSSRSHAILSVAVEVRVVVCGAGGGAPRAAVRSGLLDIVDLAGSERQRDTGAEGSALKEAGKINNSLGALAEVIKAVVENQGSAPGRPRPVPWRNSKLTMLLKRSLTGNSRTAMIFTISPAMCYWGESINTLMFADRARRLQTDPSTK